MECCDSVSDDGASGPYTNQPSGFCSPTSSLLHLPRDKTSHQSSATQCEPGLRRRVVENDAEVEGTTLGDVCERGVGAEQDDEYAVGDPSKKRGEIRERIDEEDEGIDEVECQIGEIVYQADGSAYVLQSQSELPRGVVPSSSHPPIINTCHYSSSQSSALKSFHVFHLHHPKNWCHLPGDIRALLSRQSKDRAPARTGLSEAEQVPFSRAKPILLCFLCRLSFKRVSAFRGHVSQQHSVTLSIEEQGLLSLQDTCAILQPVGSSHHPLLSFLEPKTSSVHAVSTQFATTTQGHNTAGMLSQEERENLQVSEPGLPLQPSLPRAPLPTSALSPAKDPSTLGREGTQRNNDNDLRKDDRSSREGEESLSSEVVCTAKDSVSGVSSSGRQEHVSEEALSNQSIPKSPNSVTLATSFMNNTKSLTDSELECGTSFNCHDPAPVSPSVQTSPTASTPKDLGNQETAMGTKPNDLSENGSAMTNEPNGRQCNDKLAYSDLPSSHNNSQSPVTQPIRSPLEDVQADAGSRGAFLGDGGLVGRDGMQGSSYSFGGQVIMTHSRNSCKTLKCPKCNWHYKYQQTLEAHMKEKHPDTEEGQCPYCSSGQSHPRLARGETYTCGYKPFRCQVCQYSTTTKGNLSIHMQSDKHLNNMQNLQTQTRPQAPISQPSPLPHTPPIQATTPSPSKIQGRASWRCEVCDYETNVARNLRIHMTSEKHTHNMLLLQQNLAHMQRQRRHNATELYRYCQAQSKLPDPSLILPPGDILQEPSQNQEDGDPPEGLFECVLCGRFFSDSLEALSQHLAAQRSLPDSEWRSSTGDAHHCRLCHYATPLRANFQLHCQTDKHLQRYQLAAHLQEASSNHGNSEEEDEWLLRCVAAGVQVQLRCNACNYEANSLEKLKLHTVSSRHEASLRLYKYLQQSEATMSDGVWLHCVLCDYSTQNSLSLVQHSNSLSHQRGEGLLRLQRIQKGLKDEEEELGAIFKIRKCPAQENGDVNEMESPTEITADQEEQTKHTDREGEETETSIYVEKRQSESCASPKRPLSASGDSDDSPPPKRPRAQEDISSEQVRQCPFCRFCHADIARLRSHVMIQHAVQPTLRCPLCQDTLRSVTLLRTHLTHLHSVTADCTQKLINTVIASDVLPDKMFLPVQDASAQQMKADSSCNGMKTVDERSEDEQDRMATSQPEVSKNEKQPLEDAESTKENTAAFPCWQKGCNKVLTSSSALQTHVNHVHSQKPQNPISDRHVYKYRCSQCSLAFKTAEKLQLHSQYHAIRAATMCCLCHRNFRTLQALQKHLETSHLELSEAQLQQLCGSLLMTADLLGTEGLVEEQGTLEEERVKEDEESDVEEKVNPVESDVGLGREEVEANSKQAVIPHRKGPNLSTEKFLDPSRPFKCTVCKESFTQKNILLVHYNSVSHLHKVKRSVQDSSTGLPETVSSSTTTDHKPFKCSICNVAYSQSSTLEIHMRSVLHQTKARAAKLDSSGANPAPVNSMLGKAFSLTGNTAVNSPTASKSMTAMNSSGTSTLSLNHQQGTEHNVSSSQNSSHSSTSEEAKTKHLVDMMASTTKQQQKMLQQQQQQLVQAQAQIQQELQKKAALLQSHLFNPALLHHFPISTDALLPLQQQQQLLLPFLIPGGEFQINPELNVKSPGLNISTAKAVPSEDCSESAQQASLSSSSKQTLNRDVSHMPLQSLSVAPEKKLPVLQQANGQILTPDPESNKGMDLQSNNKATSEVDESASQDNMNNFKAQEDLDEEVSSSGEFFTVFIPPRVAHNAPGNVSKALLENIGFELVMHFNENKQQCQKTEVLPNEETMSNAKEEDDSEVKGKLECESCGKLFSNTLILKSHKEHIHQSIFPIQSLEKFAKDYRQQYDKQFPCRPPTPEASPSPPSPTTPPPLPQSAEATHQKPVSSIPVTAPTVTPPAVSTPQVPLAPIPLPIDLPLFPPLMMHPMPLQGLPPPLPVHLPSVETGLTPDLSQLYQHQLTPAMMQQQQQGKRPRTRITDDQLRILRQYFDINNSPNEDQIHEMANKSGLPQKVIKHWFRNTLFKERQRNKDSPYNFSNPPITTLEDVKVDSRPSSPEPLRHEYSGGRRSSRTRFSDYQLRALQDFFDANAYPKDDEFEQLSNLLNLSTRVIVVWFQNARQKARKNYENQEEGAKESEHREFSNDRYRRTSNNNYECKKCSTVFQRIFDLINHQKKVCYKDDDEELLGEQNDLFIDPKSYSPSEATPAPSCSSLSNDTEPPMDVKSTDKQQIDPEQPHQDATISDSLTEDIKQEIPCDPEPCPGDSKLNESNPAPKLSNKEMEQASATKFSSPTIQQSKKSNTSVTQPSPVPSQSSQKSFTSLASPSPQQHLKPSQPVTPYHCIQCKLSFPSFEHWQEHQQMHFLVAQNHFVAPQFLDHPVDIPLMLFDPSNPLLARQVLSGAFPQISASSPSVAAIPDSTINSLKRKLEQKSGNSSVENDWENNGDDSQRDKRMRTTITPEQLEVLYQKYLLDSNPTRQMLDHISQEVGLKKRVVQVWFQNTRARERKGQFRALGPVQAHRRCPFCRALFKAQTALDAHIRSRHWHEAKSAGYSMAIAGMTQDQEGSQFKMDPFNFSNCSQMPNPGDGLSCPESPTSKSLDLSSHQQRLSPKPLKSGGLNDFEGSLTAQETFERSKDNYEVASMNLAHNGTMTHEENYSAEGKPNSIDQLSCSSEREASSENEDKISSGLVSPAMSFSAKDFENDLVLDYSENSSLADPASPCPGGSHSQSFEIDKHGHKRYRTQLNNLQVKVLKACFSDYKTPTMLECEALGNDIGLAKRVVQVWFQNARAKEKKAKLSLAKQFGTESTCKERPKTECTLCSVKYSGCLSVRDHVFSSQHLAKVKEALGGQMDRDRECMDPTSVCQLMTPQGMDQLKRASEVLSGIQPQSAETSGGFAHSTPQYFNLSTASIPGIGSSPVASISSTKSDPSDASSSGLIGKHMPSSSSSMLATIDKDQVSTTNSVLTPKTSELASHLQFSKESNSENPTEKVERAPVGSATHSSSSSTNKEKQESFTPATTTPKPDKEYTMEAAQLLALQAAGATDQSALLQNSLLPCLIPGFPPIFPPQIPTALTGSFLQPMFGMEGMFPYSPVLPQALMGLSPGSILQQYQHNLQGALMHHRLQLQQKQLLQQPQKIKASQVSVPAHSQDLAYNKELVLDASKPEDVQGTKKLDDGFLMSQCIVSKGTCREREKDVCLYDCLACKISLSGNEELIQHLEDPLHRQRAAEQPNAKEHASRLLPHISPSSTSQPNPPSNQKSPPASQPKPSAPETSSANAFTHSTSASQCSPTPSTSTALTGVAQASCTPASPSLPVPLPSTLTSSLSGCHPKTTDSTNVCGDRAAEEQEST